MLGREQIQALVPHGGTMCLWDEVRQWDAQQIVLAAHNHRHPGHPLRRDDQLGAIHLCEYGAQAIAVHGGLLAQQQRRAPRAGVLVALRAVQLHVARIDLLPDALVCHARQLIASGDGRQYSFHIHHQGQLLGEGRAAVILQPESA
jgi:predicted hotdog family 3-hydroxylacyl-ACP dehydratase